MPYDKPSEAPDYVPKEKRRQWVAVWNSVYAARVKEGDDKAEAERRAFAAANAKAGPESLKSMISSEPVTKEKAMAQRTFSKFIPFAKVDAARREVWGIVTAELPDKDDEVCDYEGSKPYYQAVIDEMGKATNGENFFPLREMHQLLAAGKCIGFDFRDPDLEIFMGFKVVDDAAWEKVEQNVYTGFSHGGKVMKMWTDPKFEGCKRYIANPSEVSLVDNPCLATAHFAYVKADGMIELRKFAKVLPVVAVTSPRVLALEREVTMLKAQVMGKIKTKRVDGEDLPPSAFIVVGDLAKTDTWQVPVEFADEEKTKRYLRAAIVRRAQAFEGVPEAEVAKAALRLLSLAKNYGIDPAAEIERIERIQAYMRKAARVRVNKLERTVAGGNVGFTLAKVDSDLGRLAKGLCEVSRLALLIQELGYLVYNVVWEECSEGLEDSPLPGLLVDNVDRMLTTLLTMVEAESEELREDLKSRVK